MTVPFADKCSLRIPFPNATADEEHFENYKEISRWADRFYRECLPSGGNKPYATFVVAASDSTAPDAANADYVCDGTADEVEIQAAIDALDPDFVGAGGKVLLLEGTYVLTDEILISTRHTTLEGMGWGTVLDATDVSFAGAAAVRGTGILGVEVKNLRVDGSSSTLRGVHIQNGYSRISGLWVTGCPTGINHDAPDKGLVTGCVVTGSTTAGIRIGTNGDEWVVSSNLIDTTSGNSGIVVDGDDGSLVNNYVHGADTAGIELNGDNIFCTGNYCRSNSTYGIDIWGTGCRVVGNILRNNTSGALRDNGTSTELNYPAHATNGDNFS